MYYLKYYAEIQNFRGQFSRVEIHQAGTRPGQVLIIGDVCGLDLEIQGSQDDVFTPIVKTQAHLSMISSDDKPTERGIKYGGWGEFFTPDATLYKMLIKTRATEQESWTTRWTGYITPDSWQEDLGYRTPVTITARDNIGHLQDFEFDFNNYDQYGLASIRSIITAAMNLIELPMTLDMNSAPANFQAAGTNVLDSMVWCRHFEGKDWYSVIESLLDAIGYTLRYTDNNRVTLAPIRYLPNGGRGTGGDNRSNAVPVQFYDGNGVVVPAVKSIIEDHNYDYLGEVEIPIRSDDINYGPEGSYKAYIKWTNTRPGMEGKDSPVYSIVDGGSTNWLPGSDLYKTEDPSLLTLDREGESWDDYIFLAANGKRYTDAEGKRKQALQFTTRTPNVTLRAKFNSNPLSELQDISVPEDPEYEEEIKGGFVLENIGLYTFEFKVKYESNGETVYWDDTAGWVTEEVTNTRTFEPSSMTTDVEIQLESASGMEGNGVMTFYFENIQYETSGISSLIVACHGVYARLSSFTIEPNAINLSKNTVKTNSDERYNVILRRNPEVSPLSRDVLFALPENYETGLFYYPSGSNFPEQYPYSGNWSNLNTSATKPLPVIIHQQILAFRGGVLWELSGECAPIDGGILFANQLVRYKDRVYLITSGTIDFYGSGNLLSAVLREYVDYDDIWDDTEQGDWSGDGEYNTIGGETASGSGHSGSSGGGGGSATNFFELDGEGSVKLKDRYNGLWAKGFITAGGAGSSQGGGGGDDLQSVWLSLKTNEDEFANEKIHPGHLPPLSWSMITSGKPDTLAGYGILNAYTKTEVDNLIGAIDQFHYEIYPSLASITNPASNVLYLIGPTGTGSDKYEEYVYANSTFTKIGDTTIDLSPYLTIASARATYQTIINDLSTIRSRADEGHTAYGWGNHALAGYFAASSFTAANIVSTLGTTAVNRATADASGNNIINTYATIAALNGVSGRVTTLEGRTNWDNYFGIDANGDVYVKMKDANNARNFYGYGAVTAGGVGSSGGGGGGGIDIPRVWESLTNNTDFPDTEINPAHIPDMATIYGYLKGNQQITLTGVVTGSGTTSITTSIADGALTISMVNGLQNALNAKQDTIGDLQNIRTQAAHGETAYNSLGTISDCLQSLQSQIDSVASRDGFDELTATVLFADMISTPSIYVENLSLNGNDIAGALSNLSSRATSLEGRASSLESRATSLESRATSLEGKFTGDSANSALRLAGTSAYSIWGVEYWANGVPKSVTGRPVLFIGSTQVQTSNSPQPIAGITTITASGLATIAGGISLGGTFEGVDSKIVWDATNSAWHLIGNFYADGFIVAGGTGSSGGGGNVDIDRVWESLTNNTDFPNVKILGAHIPDMAATYGYLKSITSAMVVSALGYTPFSSANFTKANIQSTLGISAWALDASKPSYSVSEITGLQSALDEKQPVISDLATIRTNAAHGETAYNSLSTVSVVLQSLQSQIDSVASRDCFDELTASVFHSDMVAVSDLYAGSISLNGTDLTTSLSGLSTAIANEATERANAIAAEVAARNTAIANAVNALDSATEAVSSGYFLTGVTITDGKITGRAQANSISGNAATATRLADNNSHYLWGVSYWASGVPQDVTAAPNLYIARTKVRASAANDTLLGVTAISNASSSGSTGDETRIEWDATNHAWHFYGGIYADTFVVAGGVGSSGGGSDIDLDRVWESLTNNTDFPDVKINLAHIPNIPWANILSKPTTIAGYGIADAKFGTQGTDYVPITLGATTKNVLTAHQSLSAYATKDYVGQQGFITKAVNDLTNYYTKTQTYTRAEVNDLIGSINQFHYEIATSTGAVTDPQSNVLYLIGPTGSGSDKYEEYVYTTQWVKIGDTSIDLTPYLTKTIAAQTYQPIISDLATIRSNAEKGSTAYSDLTTVSAILQSLQSQVDSVASRDTFDELTATVFYSDVAAVSDLYVGAISLNGVDLAGSLSSLASRATSLEGRATALEGRASTLEGYFSNGSAKSALRLTTVSKTAWGQTYWTSGGVPDSISGNMSSVGSISMNGSISGVTSITASGLIKTTNYVQATRFYLTDSIYFVADSNGVKLEGAGFYTDSFVTAGGVGSGGSGGGMDVDRMWQSLTNNPADQGYENTKIAQAHIPDMATTYGYLKGNQTITLTGVVTGSGTTSIATSIADGALTIAKVSGLQAALDSKTGNTGTVTSVGLSVPTGLSVSGSPITTSGTLAITFASGYSIPTTAQQSAWSGKQDAISDLATIRSNAANGATAYSWGNHASAGYLTSANGTTIAQALQSLQSQVNSVASRDMFDELSATVLNADTLTATSAYIGTVNGSLSGNATTASYLVSASYGIGGGLNPIYFSGGRPVASTSTEGSASVPVYLNGGTLTAITPSSLFSALSSSAATNLSVTIAGQGRTIVDLYARYDKDGGEIAPNMNTIGTALRSLQSQVDSVASRNAFDELTATVLFSDMLSVGGDATVGGTLKVFEAATLGSTLSVAGATSITGTLWVSSTANLNGALNVSNTAKISNTLTLGSGAAYPSFFLNANAQSGLKIWGEDAATSYMIYKGGKLGINMTPTNTVDITGTLGATGLATFGGGVKLTTTKKIWFDDTHYIELDSNGYLHTNAGFYSDSFITAGAANTNA